MSTQAADRLGKWLAIAGTLLALVAIVWGIRTMGLPTQQRQVRIDERRVRDLVDLQRAVRAYAQEHDTLPRDLSEVAAEPGSRVPTNDPETNVPYEYARIDADSFQLCAVFATDTARLPGEGYAAYDEEWEHGAGRQCFRRARKRSNDQP
jgi:hypothetical protein